MMILTVFKRFISNFRNTGTGIVRTDGVLHFMTVCCTLGETLCSCASAGLRTDTHLRVSPGKCWHLQSVIVCRSGFQCVAVCCSVLRCVAGCRIVLQGVAVCCIARHTSGWCTDVLALFPRPAFFLSFYDLAPKPS